MHRCGTLTRRALLGGLAAGAVGARTGWWPSEADGAAPQKPVVIAQGTDPPTLDPQFAESGDLANLENELFSRLIAYDSQMRISPDLATSFHVMPDQVTWQFKLRPGVTFWNGEPVDARAVKYTFDRVGDQALRKQGLDDPYYGRVGFDHLTIVDNYTVNFVLKEPSIVFPVYTTFNPILAPGYYSSHTPAETAIQPMGSGPWMFDEWVKDDHLRLRANPRYWRGKPQVDTLIFRIVPDASTRMAMLETSEVDLVADLSPDDVARVEGRSTLRVSKAIGGRRVNISIPTQNPIFKDRRVRQAMNLAVDFDTINKTLLRGVAFGRMAVPVNGVTWIDPKIKPYPYDPQRAKALLAEAGWKPGTAVTINSTAGRYVKDKELAEAVASYLQQVGMDASAQVLEYSVFTDKVRQGQFDMPYLIGYGSRFYGPDDLSIFMVPGFEGIEWITNTENGPKAKPLFDKLLVTFDPKQQQELTWEISRLFVEEAPWIFLWDQVALFGVNRRIDYQAVGNGEIDCWRPGGRDVRIIG